MFCLQMYKSNMESLDGKKWLKCFSINYTSLYMYLYPSIYPKYVPIWAQMWIYLYQNDFQTTFLWNWKSNMAAKTRWLTLGDLWPKYEFTCDQFPKFCPTYSKSAKKFGFLVEFWGKCTAYIEICLPFLKCWIA